MSPLRRLDRHRHDLVLEPARLLRRLGLVLRGDRELVLLAAGDLELAGDVLGGDAHVIAVEGVPQAVLDHGVDHREVAHLHAAAQMRAVRRHRHRFLPAGDDDLGVAGGDLLHAEGDRREARSRRAGSRPRRSSPSAGRRRSRPAAPGSGPGRRSGSGRGSPRRPPPASTLARLEDVGDRRRRRAHAPAVVAKAPLKEPTAVRAAPAMTMSGRGHGKSFLGFPRAATAAAFVPARLTRASAPADCQSDGNDAARLLIWALHKSIGGPREKPVS